MLIVAYVGLEQNGFVMRLVRSSGRAGLGLHWVQSYCVAPRVQRGLDGPLDQARPPANVFP
jgi:hypothetical protein